MSIELTVALISSIFTAVVGPIAVHVVKEIIDKKSKKDILKNSLQKNTLVNTKLEEIKEHLKADRVWVMQFHNGGTFYPTGKSIQKFSMFYELVSQDTFSVQSQFQNIPVSLFSKSINHLLEEDIIVVPDFKDETIATYGLKHIADENGCKSAYLFAVKTIEGKFIGTLGVEYTKKKTSLPQDDINHLLIEATMLGGELMKA
jgi:hypothetical protein